MDKRELLDVILPRLDRGDVPDSRFPDGDGEHWCLCPFHTDTHPDNFSVSEAGYKCFACGAAGGLNKLAEHLGIDARCCTVAVLTGEMPSTNISLAEYAAAKHLPVEFLKSTFSLTERRRGELVEIRMPYFDQAGVEIGVRRRIAMVGDKFRWRPGSKLNLYGLWLLDPAAPDVILVEGESDTQTLIFHGIPALGVPGATNWKPAWAEHLAGKIVYAWQEPGEAGAQFVANIGHDLPNLRVIKAPGGCE